MNKYLIKLNVLNTVYNVSAASESVAWAMVCRWERFYNPDWGYTLLDDRLESV